MSRRVVAALLVTVQGVGPSSAFVLLRHEGGAFPQVPTGTTNMRRPRFLRGQVPPDYLRDGLDKPSFGSRGHFRRSMSLHPDGARIASPRSSHAAQSWPRGEGRRTRGKAVTMPLIRAALNALVRIPSKIRALSFRIKRKLLVLVLAVCLVTSLGMSANAAVGSAGRSGGSFGPASSSYGRTYSSSPSRTSTGRPRMSTSYNNLPPQIRVYSRSPTYSPPIVIIHRNRFKVKPPRVYTTADPKTTGQVTTASSSSFASPDVATTFSVGDIVLLTGAGSLITYGFYNNHRSSNSNGNTPTSALGPGATVARLVLVLNLIPGGGHNVVDHIRDMSERADTSTRRGVQQLVSSVALELLRRESSIGSAFTQSLHFPTPSQAERAFQRQSIRNRAKFDRESFSKFGSEPTQVAVKQQESASSMPTAPSSLAVVSLHISILGDSTLLPAIRDRTDALLALNRIAADSKVEDCLMAAEILWAPDESDDVITMNDLVTDYPELVAL